MTELPKNYNHSENEAKWAAIWESTHVYRWDPNRPRSETFIIDTPPPTVSGSLHVGHVFSYTHADILARYQRMSGKNIFYPMGWDDNGLATERRVQNKCGIRCNPYLPYKPDWKPCAPESGKDKKSEEVSRRNFIEVCAQVTTEDEAAFEALWRRLALSIDWQQQYATIDDHCRRVSQISFLDLVDKKLLYHTESPTMWDVDFQTALAQADLEDRTCNGAYHDVRFGIEDGGEFTISTTRPELLVSCIAVVAHPTDERYKKLFGKFALTPLFRIRVPIVASEHADPEKGTGIMMVCTFGDIADVDWWKKSRLPARTAIGRDGRMQTVDFSQDPFVSLEPAKAHDAWTQCAGLSVEKARRKIAELLAQEGSTANGSGAALVGAPKPIQHPVKFYEKGDRPIEFVPTRQWFIRILDFKKELLEQGDKIAWHPPHMKTRYSNWVEGLAHDWCISRQRFFGVPFPVWYPISSDGVTQYDKPIFPKKSELPIDPLESAAPGYKHEQRDQPGGFTGDPDVMDTWATSSLTPQIMSHWTLNEKRHDSLFPMDIRPQSHEIIRTWAFYTIAKAWMHSNEIPWRNVVISGWILDPDRKKMSKSKGNVVTPAHLLDQYSSDAVRYWAARARLGVDTAFDEKVFKIGQKLAVKLFNASKFVIQQIEQAGGALGTLAIKNPLDVSLANYLADVIEQATAAFAKFEYAAALQATEEAFWFFCDSYVELVKGRSYSTEQYEEQQSAIATLSWALKTFVRLFAPVLPYMTEEVWSWKFAHETGAESIHRAPWPSTAEISPLLGQESPELLRAASAVLGEIHHEKTKQQKSVGSPLASLTVRGADGDIALSQKFLGDIKRASRVEGNIVLESGAPGEGKRFSVEVSFPA